jgi:hypothetical protein
LKRLLWLLLLLLAAQAMSFAQTLVPETSDAKVIQQTQSSTTASASIYASTQPGLELKIPARTLIEVEVAYTVNSLYVKPGERISFRVLVPIVIDGVTVIERDALVTARIMQAKRGGHWGKAGKLVWSMEDVVAADASRVPLSPETAARGDKLWSLEPKTTNSESTMGQGKVRGTSHSGEVAVVSIATGVLFPPLALMGGFKRGENAVLSEGRRYVVWVGKDTFIKSRAAQ